MSTVYTKQGRPLERSGDDLFSRSGKHVARLSGDRAYGPNGQYVGTLRLIYRSTESAGVSSALAPSPRAGYDGERRRNG